MSSEAEKIIDGNHLSGARLISMLESRQAEGIDLLKQLYPHTGKAFVIGITGPPGAGKSTLVDRMITDLRGRGQRVGVLAIDPSSPYSGGALLGDRVRMQGHELDEGVFIRSMASRGRMGGLGQSTREAVLVLDAMGHDIVGSAAYIRVALFWIVKAQFLHAGQRHLGHGIKGYIANIALLNDMDGCIQPVRPHPRS